MSRANASVDDARHRPHKDPADVVRDLARQGLLAQRYATATPDEHDLLTAGAYPIAWPVVFNKLTRVLERRRGHHGCAAGILQMEPDCADRFQDDVEAVLDDLFRHARVPVHNVEGWIARRLMAATIDGHRRRRGERGALQRPRLPRWLADTLGHDPWLTALAVEVLVWVGVPVSAGTGIWPWNAWADRRAEVTGERDATQANLEREVETVLAAMRRSRGWYDKFVERPLGRKQAPLAVTNASTPEGDRERQHLQLTPRHEAYDAQLADLAALAVDAIRARLGSGEQPRTAVPAVLRIAFGSTTAADLDRAPGADSAEEDHVAAMLTDPRSLERIVSAVLAILASDEAGDG